MEIRNNLYIIYSFIYFFPKNKIIKKIYYKYIKIIKFNMYKIYYDIIIFLGTKLLKNQN